jgi:hypothetical protein
MTLARFRTGEAKRCKSNDYFVRRNADLYVKDCQRRSVFTWDRTFDLRGADDAMPLKRQHDGTQLGMLIAGMDGREVAAGNSVSALDVGPIATCGIPSNS